MAAAGQPWCGPGDGDAWEGGCGGRLRARLCGGGESACIVGSPRSRASEGTEPVIQRYLHDGKRGGYNHLIFVKNYTQSLT